VRGSGGGFFLNYDDAGGLVGNDGRGFWGEGWLGLGGGDLPMGGGGG